MALLVRMKFLAVRPESHVIAATGSCPEPKCDPDRHHRTSMIITINCYVCLPASQSHCPCVSVRVAFVF